MKHLTYTSIFALSLLVSSIFAQTHTTPQATSPGHEQRQEKGDRESHLLKGLLRMSPQELAELRQTIERIEAMPEEERERLREQIRRMEKMNPHKLDKMRRNFEKIPKEKRDEMRQRWLEMSPEERLEWRKKLRDMTREERQKLLKEEGFLPSPLPRDKQKRPPHQKQNRPE